MWLTNVLELSSLTRSLLVLHRMSTKSWNMFLLSTPPLVDTPPSDYPSPTPISSPPRKLDTLNMTSSSTLTKPQLQIVIFIVLIFAFLLSCVVVAACFTYRKRLAARRASRAPSTSNRIPASSSQVLSAPASVVDLEKGVPAPSSKPMAHNEDHPQRMSLFSSFFRWRHRVLYESHPVPELALLPSYKPEESVFRKSLNTVLLKKEVKVRSPPFVPSSELRFLTFVLRSRIRRPSLLLSKPSRPRSAGQGCTTPSRRRHGRARNGRLRCSTSSLRSSSTAHATLRSALRVTTGRTPPVRLAPRQFPSAAPLPPRRTRRRVSP